MKKVAGLERGWKGSKIMKFEYDEEGNAGYFYVLKEYASSHPGVAKTIICDEIQAKGMINLDFDEESRLIGIEVLHAFQKLPKKLFEGLKKSKKLQGLKELNDKIQST